MKGRSTFRLLIVTGAAMLAGIAWLGAAAADDPARAAPAPRAITLKRDIVYSQPGEGVSLALDAYVPEGQGPFPAVLVVHGGAWHSGSKRQLGPHAKKFAERGLAAFAINYRLAPQHKFPAQIDDCKEAVRWIRKHADEYQVDPKRIGAHGYSAGGHLSALLGVTGQPDFADDAAKNNGNDAADASIQCVSAGGAPCDFQHIPPAFGLLSYWLGGTPGEVPDVYRSASPIAFVDKDDPPTFFFHGSSDELVNIKDVERMVDAMKKAGVETELFVIDGAGHIPAALNADAVERATDFLARHLGRSK